MFGFHKRTFSGPSEFFRELGWLIGRAGYLRNELSRHVSPAFRERLMMVVTLVNGCRHCQAIHTRHLHKLGLNNTEIHQLAAGQIPDDAPREELPALVYALAWAQAGGTRDAALDAHLLSTYGPESAEAIGTILRVIRFTNLTGNSADYALCVLSCGYLGNERLAS